LTLKQFFMVVGAAVVLFFLWYFFKLWFVMIVGVPLACLLTMEFFLKINGRPFHQIIIAWFSYFFNPKTYTWKRKT